jgi:RNA polymerase sigma factor (sigma-70 family)
MTDGQLLSRFVDGGDEDAFAALVKRHGPMVWGVCRRLLANHHEAEDAFQATFLVLVRKAATVLPREMVANWLYGVAYMTAHRGKVAAAKARHRERQVAKMPEPAAAEPELWDDLRPLLDQELRRLPDPYRIAVVLCDLEGKTGKQVARQLALPEGTVRSRLARGRAMLAKRLARHGLGVSAGALAAVLTKQAASAGVPAAVVSSTIKSASLLAAGQASGSISLKVAALTEGVITAMLLNKLKMAATILLVVAVITFAGLYTHQMAEAQESSADQLPAQSQTRQKETGKEEEDLHPVSKLQGTWVAVSAEANGGPLADKVLMERKPTLVISRDRFTATALLDNNGKVNWTGKILLDSTKQPLRFDVLDGRLEFTKTKGVMKAAGVKGIYELRGDTLKVCYGSERPTEFKTKPDSSLKLYVLKRQKKERSDKERIQGTWRLIKVEVNGVELSFPFLFLGAQSKELATFTGDKWTSSFMEGKGFTFKLDPDSKPKAIDLHPLEDANKTLLGIYRLVGDDLTICFCKIGKQERPSALENYWRAGSYTVLVVLKRQSRQAAAKESAQQPEQDEEPPAVNFKSDDPHASRRGGSDHACAHFSRR